MQDVRPRMLKGSHSVGLLLLRQHPLSKQMQDNSLFANDDDEKEMHHHVIVLGIAKGNEGKCLDCEQRRNEPVHWEGRIYSSISPDILSRSFDRHAPILYIEQRRRNETYHVLLDTTFKFLFCHRRINHIEPSCRYGFAATGRFLRGYLNGSFGEKVKIGRSYSNHWPGI